MGYSLSDYAGLTDPADCIEQYEMDAISELMDVVDLSEGEHTFVYDMADKEVGDTVTTNQRDWIARLVKKYL